MSPRLEELEELTIRDLANAAHEFMRKLEEVIDDPRIAALKPVLAHLAVVLAGRLVLDVALEARVQDLETRIAELERRGRPQ